LKKGLPEFRLLVIAPLPGDCGRDGGDFMDAHAFACNSISKQAGWKKQSNHALCHCHRKIHVELCRLCTGLPGCVATAATIKETETLIREAIEFHLEGLGADNLPIPRPAVM
jgi:hypothetical protein